MDTADDFLTEFQTGLPPEAGATVAEVVQPAQAVAVADEHPVEPEKRGRGRPPGVGSTFTQEKADALCSLIISGTTMTASCKALEIPLQTVQQWRNDHDDFAGQLACAREVGYDVMADECIEIAGERPYFDDKGKPDVSPQKLKIETRVKLLALWSRRYREKETEAAPAAPTTVNVQINNVVSPTLEFGAVRERVITAQR